jgi:nucleotide-binding universal stress UspA family protein
MAGPQFKVKFTTLVLKKEAIFMKMLVGIIGDKVSRKVAEKAVEVAKKCDGEITFISVVDDSESKAGMPYSFGTITKEEFIRSKEIIITGMMEQSDQMLDSIIDSFKSSGIKMSKIVARGVSYEEIVETAEKGDFDLIIVGHTGTSLIRRVFLGSVAKRVIEGAHCTVMVVK